LPKEVAVPAPQSYSGPVAPVSGGPDHQNEDEVLVIENCREIIKDLLRGEP